MTQDRPLEFRLCGRLGCRGGGLAFVPGRLCRTRFHALNERKTDDSQSIQAAAHSNHTLVAVDRGSFLRRHCSGRRGGSHWLDCISTAWILVHDGRSTDCCAPNCRSDSSGHKS